MQKEESDCIVGFRFYFMKKLLTIVFFMAIAITTQAATNITGTWRWSNSDTSSVFTLILNQNVDSINGYHSIVAHNGLKIDDEQDIYSIKGVRNGDVFNVTFKSSFTDNLGNATIIVIGNKSIQWTITKVPDGECYFPANVILTKQ